MRTPKGCALVSLQGSRSTRSCSNSIGLSWNYGMANIRSSCGAVCFDITDLTRPLFQNCQLCRIHARRPPSNSNGDPNT